MYFCSPIPQDTIACYLFTYNGKVVAIDLVGAGIPLLVSAVFVLQLARGARFRPSPRRLFAHVLMIVALGLLVAAEFVVWRAFFNTISIQTQVFLFTLVYPAGAIEFYLFDRGAKARVSPLKPYVAGSLALVLGDLVRTLSGSLEFTPQVIGANRLIDGVFLAGLFMTIAYLFVALVYFRWRPPAVPPT